MGECRKDFVYLSPVYTGVFESSTSGVGHLERRDSKSVEKWIEANSMGRVKIGNLGETRHLFYHRGFLWNVCAEIVNQNPPCPEESEEITYRVKVKMSVSLEEELVPKGLENALKDYRLIVQK